jgi:tetratricopeptide (TPR) repeat protein
MRAAGGGVGGGSPHNTFPRNVFLKAISAALLSCLCVFCPPLRAQTPPDLPAINLDDFAPGVREQVRAAYADAQAKPQDAAAAGRLGLTLHAYEQYEAAARCYERARRLAPEEFRWAYYFAVARAALGSHAEAADAFRDALRRRPDYAPAQLRLADSLLALGQLAEGEKLYEAVARQNNGLAQAHYGLGRVKTAGGDKAAGVEHYRRALAVFREYGAAHYALGLALRDLGETAQAREHLALSQQYKSSRPPLADPLLDAVAELNAGASEYLRRGVLLDGAGQIEQSIAEHERALAVNPRLVQAHINLISLYSRAGRSDKAEQHYRAAVAINPNLADSHYNFGVLLVGQERYAEAAEAFLRAARLNPFHAEAHQNYAALIEGEGKLDEAAEHYRKAIENKPGYRLAHFHLGRILVHQGKLAEAVEQFHQTLTPEDEETPRYLYALGATYARAGEVQKATHYLRESLKLARALGQTQLAASVESALRSLAKNQP